MTALKILFTTDTGLASLAVIGFLIGMGAFFWRLFVRKMREEERAEPVSREVDTTGLAVDAAAERLSEELPTPPPAPDTSHLDMGQVGETIPNLASADTPLTPDINAFSLSPTGTDFSDCHPPASEALPLDLSNLDLAPPGADVLEAKYRKQDTKAAPDTDHIFLQD